MPVPKSKYPCPDCGEYQLMYPDVKGGWGWKDATKYFCYACQHTFSVKFVLANTACTRLETGAANADSESNPAVSSG